MARGSVAERELRDVVVARLRQLRPNARIIHEVNVSTWGPNRMDVIAVDHAEILAVEIKSERDKLDRAAKQVAAMMGAAHYAILALHESHLVEKVTNEWNAHYSKIDGKHYFRDLPDEAKTSGVFTWIYPERERGPNDYNYAWRNPGIGVARPLPSTALDMLWRDELADLCGRLRVSRNRRATMPDMLDALRWHCTGRELTEGICRALRSRRFAEADPPMVDSICEAQLSLVDN